jgi:biotin carboxyl carrier protein
MADLRAPRFGTIAALLVDEGTLIAEEDELVVLDDADGATMVVAAVPGVLREWFVGPGDAVAPGAVLALIDES